MFAVVLLTALLFQLAVKSPRKFITVWLISIGYENQKLLESNSIDFLLGTIRVGIQDIFAIVMLLAFLIGTHKSAFNTIIEKISISTVTLLVVLGLFSWSIATGLETAVNFWRIWISLGAALLYGESNSSRVKSEEIAQSVIFVARIISIFVFLHILLFGLSSAVELNYADGTYETLRAVTATAALILLLAVTYEISQQPRTRLNSFSIVANTAALVLAQHRTVWIAAVFFFAYHFFRQKISDPIQAFMRFATFVAVIVSIFLLSQIPQLRISGSSSDTLVWREERWSASFEVQRSAQEWFLGGTFGPTAVQEKLSSLPFAHNFFVLSIETVGLLGASAILILLLGRFFAAENNTRYNSVRWVIAGIFSLFYGLPAFLGLLLLVTPRTENVDK